MTVLFLGEELFGEFREVRIVEPDPHSQNNDCKGKSPKQSIFPRIFHLQQWRPTQTIDVWLVEAELPPKDTKIPFFASPDQPLCSFLLFLYLVTLLPSDHALGIPRFGLYSSLF